MQVKTVGLESRSQGSQEDLLSPLSLPSFIHRARCPVSSREKTDTLCLEGFLSSHASALLVASC